MNKKLLLSFFFLIPTAYADVLSVFCPQGCPESPVANDLEFTHIYALSNNPVTKFADWVAYEVNPVNYGVSPGRNWKSDPLLDNDETLEESDYKGANRSALEADRGHQAPLASFAGSRYWYEANYLSNITPQDKDLNQGPWKELEDAVRAAASYEHPLYVITGPLYNKPMESLPGADESHQVPSGYFKIVYDQSGSVSFMMNQSSNRKDSYCSTRGTVADIQKIVKFKLPDFHPSKVLDMKLGCK